MNKSLITILGAGAAGIGMATTLNRLGIEDVQVIDKGEIGESFRRWSPYTRFISPSFNTTGFGFPDLNAITPDTSPGLFMEQEHLSGQAYATYLTEVARYFDLNVKTHEKIKEIKHINGEYLLVGEHDSYQSTYLITALGDFHFPNTSEIKGAENGVHYTALGDYSSLPTASSYTIIGGNESGFDAAIQLAKQGKKAVIYTDHAGIDSESPDPSKGISLYTRERYEAVKDFIQIKRGVRISEIAPFEKEYYLMMEDGTGYKSEAPPILATGFSSVNSPLIDSLFDIEDKRAVLTELDESTIYPNLFMVGPQVEHEGIVLCFIYKYRQRFAVIGNEIAARQGILVNHDELKRYKDAQMYLDDLSCCGTDCVC